MVVSKKIEKSFDFNRPYFDIKYVLSYLIKYTIVRNSVLL